MKSKKLKENPLMSDGKNTKRINKGFVSEEENEVKTFIIIVLVIALLAGIIYFVTDYFKNKDEADTNTTTASINYDKVSVGMFLNRPYENYYILVYDSESADAIKYSTLISLYKQKSDAKKIYFCDLNNSLNNKYYNVNNDNKSNPEAKEIKDLDFGDLTLLEIKNGKIVKYIEDYTTIQEKLK